MAKVHALLPMPKNPLSNTQTVPKNEGDVSRPITGTSKSHWKRRLTTRPQWGAPQALGFR